MGGLWRVMGAFGCRFGGGLWVGGGLTCDEYTM